MIQVSPDTLRLKEIRNQIVEHEEALKAILQRIEDLGWYDFKNTKVFTVEMDHVRELIEQQIGHNICEDFKQPTSEVVN